MIYIETHTFNHFYYQYLVLLTMVPRNSIEAVLAGIGTAWEVPLANITEFSRQKSAGEASWWPTDSPTHGRRAKRVKSAKPDRGGSTSPPKQNMNLVAFNNPSSKYRNALSWFNPFRTAVSFWEQASQILRN